MGKIIKPEPANDRPFEPAVVPAFIPEGDVKPKVDQGESEAKAQTTACLERVASATSTETLEAGVKLGVQLLNTIKGPLEIASSQNTTEAGHWLKEIQELENLAKPTRTIVGVVGNTGAGKSSVISAVLDEERLLPTNCMRACTASPTEISYNECDDSDKLYRAEVEFITSDDWKKELEALFSDLLDQNGEVCRDSSNQETDAGVAYAKIKAVYPKKTKEDMARSNPTSMANETLVRITLGTTRKIQATTAKSLYQQLQHYVDSKEKNTDKSMEYWPLIKVVRIYTKAAALATGACLVDLPGVQDSNAARAAVAEKYMKACTGLWIVAPITRAVDDKTAKNLLGDSFRRQLKFDGTYSAVTFICSKTDDISVTEAAESLGLEHQIHEDWDLIQALEDRVIEENNALRALKDEKTDCEDAMDDLDDEREKWEGRWTKVVSGETVYAQGEASAGSKRKRSSQPTGSRKHRSSPVASNGTIALDDDDGSDKENGQGDDDEDRVPLTEDQIEEKMASIKADKKFLRQKKKEFDEKISVHKAHIKMFQEERRSLMEKVRRLCIQGRNDYSRGAIKRDFAAGIKELDQENAAEADEAAFNPEEDLRDYTAVEESLPVFCVSSRAFQKLSGRLAKDNINDAGFQDIEDTEVPQLQAHARKLTEAGRAAACRRFLNNLTQLVNSMTMWATDDGTRSNLADGQKRVLEKRVRQALQRLQDNLEHQAHECVQEIDGALHEYVYSHLEDTVPQAAALAVGTASGWGAHKNLGGLHWATYKATVRRNGAYSGSFGLRDFNAELIEPISKGLANPWERAFHRNIPRALDQYGKALTTLLKSFHQEAVKHARDCNAMGTTWMLDRQSLAHIQTATHVPQAVRQLVQDRQRDANRGFVPQIQEEMTPAYVRCVEERGSGSFMRMKQAMVSHVEQQKDTMFQNAVDTVHEELSAITDEVREHLTSEIANIYAKMARDYLSVLVGANASTINSTPRAERMLRAEMIPLLRRADKHFADLATPVKAEANLG